MNEQYKLINDRSSKDGRARGDIREVNVFKMSRVPCSRCNGCLLFFELRESLYHACKLVNVVL